MTTAIQDTPITISLTQLAISSGWALDGIVAEHDGCNDGNLYLLNYPLTLGQTYRYTFPILTMTSGYLEVFLGTNHGAQYTTAQNVDETIVANGAQLYIYANGNCSIENFAIESVQVITSPTSRNTISFSEKTDKWIFYNYIPDYAFSLFTDTFSFYQGNAYFHQQGSPNRCNFYGVQYPAQLSISTNESPTLSKTFISLNYQCNQLLLSPSIETSLGQRSLLDTGNFLQATYNDGTQVYSTEGQYHASFLRDMNVDLYNGPPLKGNWMVMDLITTSPSTPLNLFSTEIQYAKSYQNIR